jgi:hypothetical protein
MIVRKAWGITLLLAGVLGGIKYLFDLFEKSRGPKG